MTDTRRDGARAPEGYDPTDYPAFALTVDIPIFTIRNGVFSVLLVRRSDDPYRDGWALPGGFVNVDETVDEAASRELREETSLDMFHGHMEQLRTYYTPGRDPRMPVVTSAYVAFAPDLPEPVAGSDARDARWWAINDLGLDGNRDDDTPTLAFDHERILTDAVERVRAKLEYTTLACQFVGPVFTLKELFRVYVAVWGYEPDLGNWRRKVLGTEGFVSPVDGETAATGGRPATLYQHAGATDVYPPMVRAAKSA